MDRTTALCLLSAACLAGCGGGGGGGSGTIPDPIDGGTSTFPTLSTFTSASFPDVPSRALRATADNVGILSAAEANPQGRVDFAVERTPTGISSITLTVTDVNGLTFTQVFSSLTRSTVTVGGVALNDFTQVVATGPASARTVEYFDSTSLGFSYVTLGQWASIDGAVTIGSFVPIGFQTPGASIPTTGGATFIGFLAGLFAPAGGTTPLVVGANATAVADFAGRSVSFSTANSQTSQLVPSLPPTSNAGLNLNGTLSYAAGSNQITGTVTSANGMTGGAVARFYGPAAQEIGGSLAVTGTAGGMAAGFIAKR